MHTSIMAGDAQLKARIWVAFAALFSAFFIRLICVSNDRAKAIMLTIESTGLTLLPSSAPPATARRIGRRRRAVLQAEQAVVAAHQVASAGLTSFSRPSTVGAPGLVPVAMVEMVPSPPIATVTSGGTVIGPPSPAG